MMEKIKMKAKSGEENEMETKEQRSLDLGDYNLIHTITV
jgi:hypothetical protein